MRRSFRSFSAHLFSGVLTMIAIYVAVRTGTIGITVLGLMIILFQYLIGELLTSERRGKELERVANTDELTGLANRERFRTQLEDRITRAGRAGESFAVMLLDLDRFKEINDTLGHHYGDQLCASWGRAWLSASGRTGSSRGWAATSLRCYRLSRRTRRTRSRATPGRSSRSCSGRLRSSR